MKKFKTIGILGGMGPAASAHFYQLLLKKSQEKYESVQDDEYPPIIINSLALIGSSENGMENNDLITQQLIKGAVTLEQAGANFMVIPCNSVHNIIKELRANVKIPILGIIEQVSNQVIANKSKKVLVLSSETTDKYGLYDGLKKNKITVIKPDQELRKLITTLILAVMGNQKTKEAKEPVINIINKLFSRGKIDSVILGCTELPLVISQADTNVELYDSLEILSKSALEFARI